MKYFVKTHYFFWLKSVFKNSAWLLSTDGILAVSKHMHNVHNENVQGQA